jgi:hypothetical protein
MAPSIASTAATGAVVAAGAVAAVVQELELEPPRCSSRHRAGAAGAVAAAVLELEPPPPPASVEELNPVMFYWGAQG